MFASVLITLFVLVPLSLIALFLVCLCRYLSAKKQDRQVPGSVAPELLKERKLYTVLSGVIAGIFLAAVIGIVVLFAMAIAYM